VSKKCSHRERNYSPLQNKTLNNVLLQQFVNQFGYENKEAFAEIMIERILETVDAFVRPVSLLKPGQMLWMAVPDDGKKHAYKPMSKTPQVPVVLDLVTDEDLQALADGEDFAIIRRRRHARLMDQTKAQTGALAYTDLSAITLTSNTQVRADAAQVEETEDRILPHRGTVHDIGPTTSHKAEVARLLEEGYLEPEICKKLSPVHSLSSVERYAQTYKNSIKLLKRGFSPEEISGILSTSKRLLEEYIAIINEHHPEIIADNPHLQELVP